MRKLTSLLLLVCCSPVANAQDIFHTAATTFFHSDDRFKRVGIEMEMAGLSFEELERILSKHFKISKVTQASPIELHLTIPEGIIKLKIEGQAWRYELEPEKYKAQLAEDIKVAPREIVFPPLTYQRASVLQAVSDDLEKAGALGTTPERAVAFQVNYEIGSLRDDERRVQDVVDILRTYYDESNMKQIDEVLQVPASRREFLNDLTPGFRKKLFNAGYTPSLREFFDDYLYRQSAELFGYRNAWTGSIDELWAFLTRLKDPVHPTVLKMQRVRVSSLLLEAFPEDPLVKEVVASRWAVPAPIIEFREFNMVFKNVDSDIRTCLGLVGSVKEFGYYKHDVLMSKLTGIPESDFPRIRKKVREGKPFIVRYLLEDPKTNMMTVAEREVPGSKALWTQLASEHPGRFPLNIAGESIVFNRRHIHRSSIMGKYNPGLDHGYIQQALENKLTEAKIFGAYAPGSMPNFDSLKNLVDLKADASPKKVFKAASERFPKGWVMKGSWDLGSEKSFISSQIDIKRAMKDYEDGFEKHRKKILDKFAGRDPEFLMTRFKEHPGYQGWKILNMLEHPDQVFFQEMISIDREFRVEVLNGQVVRGATIDRYAYMEKKAKPPTASEIAVVEDYTQKMLDGLPEELKVLPYGLDVARLKKGGFMLIETNPGGNSSFLEESVPSVKLFEKALMDYRAVANEQGLKRLTPREEMTWLKEQFLEFKISPVKDYPGMLFTSAGIQDPEYMPLGHCPTLFQPYRH